MIEKKSRDWAIIIVPILVAGLFTVVGCFFSYFTAKTEAYLLVQGELTRIQTQFSLDLKTMTKEIELAAQKRVLLEKQKVNKDTIQCLLDLKFAGKQDKATMERLQQKLNDVTARIYVFCSDDVVKQMNAYAKTENPEKRKVVLRNLILSIRKETYEESGLCAEDIFYPRVSPGEK